MNRRITALALVTLLSLSVCAESHRKAKEFEPLPTFTWGIRAGFAASSTYVSDGSINGQKISEYNQDTQVGNFLAFQCRLNSKRLFLQSGVGLGYNKSSFSFSTDNLLQNSGSATDKSLSYSLTSLMLPVQFGYHIVNQSPYCFSIFTGPRIRITPQKYYKTTFENFGNYDLTETVAKAIFGWTFGISVQISRTFLDFEYDAGIGNFSKGITETSGAIPAPDIRMERRLGTISFSYGLMF